MPELIEVEAYRELASSAIGHRIDRVWAPDPWYLKHDLTPERAAGELRGSTVRGARRLGKLLLLDTDGPTLGLRFGMTGRLLLDGRGPIDRLLYSSERHDPAWVRFGFDVRDVGGLEVIDPRRLGGVVLDPDLSHLGVDALDVDRHTLASLLEGSRSPVKAWLLDQSKVAGVGNLLADEALWRAGIDPARPAGSLDPSEVRRLHQQVRTTIRVLSRRGGSHTGDLQAARTPGATCPRDGATLLRRTIGGRSTYSCPLHQR